MVLKIEEVIEYLGNKDNFTDPDYIKHILYWRKFTETYRGLANISNADGLNKTQLILKENFKQNLMILWAQIKMIEVIKNQVY